MASRALLLVALLSRLAFAQEAPLDSTPPEDPPDSTQDEPSPDATPPDAESTPAESTPAEQPAAPSAPPPSDSVRWDGRALVLGLGLGMAGATGSPSDVYGVGFGLGLTIGFSFGKTAIEARLGAGYATMPKYDALQGRETRGSFDARTLLVRRMLTEGKLAVSAAAGVASTSVPLLSFVPDDIDPTTTHIRTSRVEGTGIAASFAVHKQVNRVLDLVVDATAYYMLWELPGAPYVHPTTDDTGAAMLTYTRETADISSIPWIITVGIRLTIH